MAIRVWYWTIPIPNKTITTRITNPSPSAICLTFVSIAFMFFVVSFVSIVWVLYIIHISNRVTRSLRSMTILKGWEEGLEKIGKKDGKKFGQN